MSGMPSTDALDELTDDELAEQAADRFWLHLEVESQDDGARGAVQLGERHVTPFDRLYGGSGTAIAAAMIEAATRRRLLWLTTQFVGVARRHDRLTLRAEVLAAGRRVSQVRVTAHLDGALVLHAVGAAGRHGPGIPDHTLPAMPRVPPPQDCPLIGPYSNPGQQNFFDLAERRDAGTDGAGHFWIRVSEASVARPALLGLAADIVPYQVMTAIGEPGAGTSLDNNVRVGARSRAEWVLVEGAPTQTVGGFGHGAVHLWSPDGALVGSGGQTAAMWRFGG
jgi:acyl-CoA thioesterase